MRALTLYRNTLLPEESEHHWVSSAADFLRGLYPEKCPDNLAAYLGEPCQANQIDLATKEGQRELEEGSAPITVYLWPGDPGTLLYIGISLALAAAAYALTPAAKAPQHRAENQQMQSASSVLSDHKNRLRPYGRLQDGFGRNLINPDKLTDRLIWDNQNQYLLSLLAVGRGDYEIDPDEIWEGDTPFASLPGSSIEIYGPNSLPPSPPAQTIGPAIADQPKITEVARQIAGKDLEAPNAPHYRSPAGQADIRFVHPNKITIEASSGVDLTEHFTAGENLTLVGQTFDKGVASGQIAFIGETATIETLFDYGGPSGTFRLLEQSWTFDSPDFVKNFRKEDKVSWTGVPVITHIPPGPSPPTLTINLNGSGRVVSIDEANNKFVFVWISAVPDNIEHMNAYGYDQDTTSLSIEVLDTTTRTVDVSGSFTIGTVAENEITLASPENDQPDWATIQYLVGQKSNLEESELTTIQPRPLAPVKFMEPGTSEIQVNIIAQRGLFKVNMTSGNRKKIDVTCKVVVRPVDALGNVVGTDTEEFTFVLDGSAHKDGLRGATGLFTLANPGRCQVTVERVTDMIHDIGWDSTEAVEVQSVYGLAPLGVSDFGNATTIWVKIAGSKEAFAIEDLEIKLIGTRKVPLRLLNGTWTAPTATRRMDHIFVAAATDPYIGGFDLAELDLDQIYGQVAAMEAHHDTELAIEFNGLFDSNNEAPSEALDAIAGVARGRCFRQGGMLQLSCENPSLDPVMLLGHRTIPVGRNQKNKFVFGNQDGHTRVEARYVDFDGKPQTLVWPENASPYKPLRMELFGVRNRLQALFIIHVAYNKIVSQPRSSLVKATEQAVCLAPNMTVGLADTTDGSGHEGYVAARNDLVLTLSQPFNPEPGVDYLIRLQMKVGGVDVVPVSPVVGQPYQVLLSGPTVEALVLPEHGRAHSTNFQLIPDTEPDSEIYLVLDQRPGEGRYKTDVSLVQWKPEFYAFDTAFKDNLVDDQGYPLT